MLKRIFKRMRSYSFARRLSGLSRSDRFREIYRSKWWGGNKESFSGAGSTLANTLELRRSLPIFLKEKRVNVLLDAPCGDLNWMRTVELPHGTKYIGADIVPELINKLRMANTDSNRSFLILDLVEDCYPSADLLMCRDCLFHLSEREIFEVLNKFVDSKIPMILTTYMPNVSKNKDIETGRYRPLNLTTAPFNLPEPEMALMDYTPPRLEKYLALWTHEQIAGAIGRLNTSNKFS